MIFYLYRAIPKIICLARNLYLNECEKYRSLEYRLKAGRDGIYLKTTSPAITRSSCRVGSLPPDGIKYQELSIQLLKIETNMQKLDELYKRVIENKTLETLKEFKKFISQNQLKITELDYLSEQVAPVKSHADYTSKQQYQAILVDTEAPRELRKRSKKPLYKHDYGKNATQNQQK